MCGCPQGNRLGTISGSNFLDEALTPLPLFIPPLVIHLSRVLLGNPAVTVSLTNCDTGCCFYPEADRQLSLKTGSVGEGHVYSSTVGDILSEILCTTHAHAPLCTVRGCLVLWSSECK